MNDNTQPTNPPTVPQAEDEKPEVRQHPATIERYVHLLRLASNKPFPRINAIPANDRRFVRELIDAGLLSDARREAFGGKIVVTDIILLTPAGVNALAEWSDFLRRESWWYKVGDSVLRALWVLLGAICALLPDIIRRVL
jgi:hypothetical protein